MLREQVGAEIKIKQLTPDLLKDYLYFFDKIVFTENPDCSNCYCFSYHFIGTNEQWNKEDNRASVIKYVNENKLKGLAFGDNQLLYAPINPGSNAFPFPVPFCPVSFLPIDR